MKFYSSESREIFVRLDPGDELVASLRRAMKELNLHSAAIISGVGMARSVQLGFYDVDLKDYHVKALDQILDINSITGNIVPFAGTPHPHVHAILNTASHQTVSGHLIEAQCHITMEIFLLPTETLFGRLRTPESATHLVEIGEIKAS